MKQSQKYTRGLVILLTIFSTVSYTRAQTSEARGLSVSSHDITVLVNANETFEVFAIQPLDEPLSVTFEKQHENLISLDPESFVFAAGNVPNQTIIITGLSPGKSEVTAKTSSNSNSLIEDLFLRITVANSNAIIYVSSVFGWVYFVAWSISFYPQIYINFKRKSVVGLNFDFVVLNILGFTLYSAFNCGLYWNTEIQAEYAQRHPRGLNPVMLNDVVFSLHALFATILTVIQCIIYERANQRVSRMAIGLLGIYAIFIVISIGLAAGSVVTWLTFLYYCSYVKLSITIIKYIPQALMNYRRKSTVGWSIGNILLDFTGGMLSMLQMILNAYNYDDWASLFGDPTKFGLGLFSVLFDVFFMLQHYVFYRHASESSTSDLTTNTEAQATEKNSEQA